MTTSMTEKTQSGTAALLIDRSARYEELTVADLLPFVDSAGRLEVRIEGEAARRPFAVLNLLRGAGFLHAHTWVDERPADGPAARPVALRVTAVLPAGPAPTG